MWLSDTVGGSAASARSTCASRSGSCGASRSSGRGASGAGPSRKKRSPLAVEPLREPRRPPPSSAGTRRAAAPAPRPPPRARARRAPRPRRRTVRAPSAPAARRPARGTRRTRPGRAPPARRAGRRSARRSRRRRPPPGRAPPSGRASAAGRTGPRTRRGPARAHGRASPEANGRCGRGSSARPWPGPWARSCVAVGRSLPVVAPEELPVDEERGREHEQHDRDLRVQPQPEVLVRRVDPEQLLEEAAEACRTRRRARTSPAA